MTYMFVPDLGVINNQGMDVEEEIEEERGGKERGKKSA